MNIALGIVSHPQRLVYAEQLQAQINADFISTDDGRGAYANHVKVWQELADTDSEYSLVLEDDCIPVINFNGQLAKALAACPTNICSIYTGRLRPPQHQAKVRDALEKATANEACWLIGTHLYHAVAVAMRTSLIRKVLAQSKPYLPIDEALGAAARKLGEPIAYSVPSLCDHNDSLPTLMKHRDRQPRPPGAGRIAWSVGSRTTWDNTAVTL